MTNLDHLFCFPIVMVDGDNEEKRLEQKEKLGLEDDGDVDIIMGEACVPYYDFVSISDRWLPTMESLENAMNKKFDACGVLFGQSGTYIVPWSKEKFKRELQKFMDKQPKDDVKVLTISKQEVKELLGKIDHE